MTRPQPLIKYGPIKLEYVKQWDPGASHAVSVFMTLENDMWRWPITPHTISHILDWCTQHFGAPLTSEHPEGEWWVDYEKQSFFFDTKSRALHFILTWQNTQVNE